jgi:Fur family ferric uptake transcriptional regulator
MSCEETFLKELKKRGYRFTPQRELVLEIMHQVEKPSTADEIYSCVQERVTSVDISTVYRTLELLQEFGLVAAIHGGDRQLRFELLVNREPHVHLVCRSCGKIFGVSMDEVQPLLDQLKMNYGFQPEVNEITLPGLCKECQEKMAGVSVHIKQHQEH